MEADAGIGQWLGLALGCVGVKDGPGERPIRRFFATKLSVPEACEMPALPINPRGPEDEHLRGGRAVLG